MLPAMPGISKSASTYPWYGKVLPSAMVTNNSLTWRNSGRGDNLSKKLFDIVVIALPLSRSPCINTPHTCISISGARPTILPNNSLLLLWLKFWERKFPLLPPLAPAKETGFSLNPTAVAVAEAYGHHAVNHIDLVPFPGNQTENVALSVYYFLFSFPTHQCVLPAPACWMKFHLLYP